MAIKWLSPVHPVNYDLEQNLCKYGTKRSGTDISRESLTPTSSPPYSKSWEQTSPPLSFSAQVTKRRHSESSFHSLLWLLRTWVKSQFRHSYEFMLTESIAKEILYLRSPGVGRQGSQKKVQGLQLPGSSFHANHCRAQPGSSHSSAPCPWDSTKAGIRFSSTCRTSRGGPTEPTTLRRLGKRSRLWIR